VFGSDIEVRTATQTIPEEFVASPARL
jgi:hypothetical protein